MKRLLTTMAFLTLTACGTEDVELDAPGVSDEAIEFLDANGLPCEPDIETWVPGNPSPDGPQDGTGSQSGSGSGSGSGDRDGSGEPQGDRTEVHGRGCDAYGCCGVPSGSQGEGGSGSGSGGGGSGSGSGGGGSGSGGGGSGSSSGSGGSGSGSGSGGSGSGSGSGGGG